MKAVLLWLLTPFRGTGWIERALRRKWPPVKGRIETVGTVVLGGDGTIEQVEGWQIDAKNCAAAMEISYDGEVFLAGYSLRELQEISSRAEEFTP